LWVLRLVRIFFRLVFHRVLLVMNKNLSRREFLQVSSATAIAGSALSAIPAAVALPQARGPFRGTLCLFSKAVPPLNWRELAQSAKQAGFGGIDLTVRSEGHVLPERAEADLPKAVEAIRAEGLEVPMITTELVRADHPTAEPIMRTASRLSIPFMKSGYYYYKLKNVLQERDEAGRQFRGLVELASKHQIQVGYHNHNHYVGASIWDMAAVIEPLDPRRCGYYFDIGNATTDGVESGWEIEAHLVMPRLKMVAIKDFMWKRLGPHDWKIYCCPLGQGMVHWREFMQLLAKANFHGPISLHEEFLIPGYADEQGRAVSRAAVPKVMATAKENLDYLKSLVEEAYGKS
jgi:sugar phosphate isomerase/epimerase